MREEAERQLALILQQQEVLAPELYRDLALYLQVLREGLLHRVQQACFHLATQVVPERYNALPPQKRQAFQNRLQELVARCSPLLTLEQLMALAAQQQRRERRRQRSQEQQLLDAFLNPEPDSLSSDAQEAMPASDSVHLSMDLPVSADVFDRGLPGLSSQPPALSAASAPADANKAQQEQQQQQAQQQLLQSLFQLAAEGLQQQPEAALADTAEPLEPQEASAADEQSALFCAAPLPRDPIAQLRWWNQFDRALRRRLRNLSHAVNVEMLRLGLAQGLLPIHLLDAVLDGLVDVLPAPANLLRLPLPIGQPLAPGAPTEVLTLLLRTSDLEYDLPPLRTCRKRLEQRRAALRTMAKRHRNWQRRLSALQAEQQWFQDSAPNTHPPAERS